MPGQLAKRLVRIAGLMRVLSRPAFLASLGVALLAGVLIGFDPTDAPRLLIEFGGIVLSTFIGAWAAFALQTSREERKLRAGHAAAMREAQFALVAQISVLRGLDQHYLAEWRNDPNRDVRLKGIRNHQEIPAINLGSLGFLLTSDDPDLPNVLLDCQNKCNVVLGILDDRFEEMRRFLAKVQVAQQEHKLPEEVTADLVREAVGGEICGALRALTDDLYDAVDRAIVANDVAFAQLGQQMNKQFPGEPVLHRTPEPDLPISSGSPPDR